MKAIHLYLMVLLFLSINCLGQSINPALAKKMQLSLDSFRVTYNLKGISACVLYPGSGHWKGVSGISYQGAPIQSEMVFGIGSNTKLFTAVLLLKLAEMRTISLDDSIFRYISKQTHIDSNITIRQLLNHTSGLADVTNVLGYPDSMLQNPNRIFTATEILHWIGPALFKAGTDWEYSNTNYILAGLIAEKATGIPFHQLLRDHILKPLHLDSTYLDVYEPCLFPIAHPWQAGVNNFNVSRTSLNSAAWAAGAMYSTSEEMVQWYQGLMLGQLIDSISLKQMTNFTGKGNYGLGISQAIILGRKIWTHGGSIWGGYNSTMMYDPSSGITICVLINQLPAPAFQLSVQLLSDLLTTPSGIYHNTFSDAAIQIYPNPGEGIFHIETKVQGIKNIMVFDFLGRLIFETKEKTIDLRECSKGIYTINIQTAESMSNYKLIKE